MGRRNLLTKYQVFTNADSTTAEESEKTVIDQLDNIKYTIVIGASVDCEVEVQFSDDKITKDEVWRPLKFASALTLVGATDTEYTIIIKEAVSHKLRLFITNNAGTGTINAWISGNDIGA